MWLRIMNHKFLTTLTPLLSIIVTGFSYASLIYDKAGNKIDLYGKATGLHYFGKHGDSDGDKSNAKLGFRGETQINDLMTGFGQWEYDISTSHSEDDDGDKGNSTQLGFAGLSFGQYGSIDYGRNFGVLYDVAAWTDLLPEFGGKTWSQADTYMAGRGNGMLTYRNSGLFGLVDNLDIATQYQGKNGSSGETNNGRNRLAGQNGDSWSLSSAYTLNYHTAVSVAYGRGDRTHKQVAAGRDKGSEHAHGNQAEAWAVGLKFDDNYTYLAATFSETHNMTRYGRHGIAGKTQNLELVAQYQFDYGLRPSIAYIQSRGNHLNSQYGAKQDLFEYIEIGASYFFNKNMSTYVDYMANMLNKNKFTRANHINTDNIAALGLTYQF